MRRNTFFESNQEKLTCVWPVTEVDIQNPRKAENDTVW